MFSLRANVRQILVLGRHCQPSAIPVQCGSRSFNDLRQLVRKPLKKFRPTTSMKELQEFDENDFYDSKLKQARKIAGESHEIITPRSKSQIPAKMATSTKKIEKEEGKIGDIIFDQYYVMF